MTEKDFETPSSRMCCGWKDKGHVDGPLTREKWEEMENNPVVANLCHQMAAIIADPSLDDKTRREAYDRLKKQLPWYTPHAQAFRDNHRTAADAEYNGLVMFDVDHIHDPRSLWNMFVENGGLKKYRVVLAHVTPSTHGLRIVFENRGGSIEENQAEMADFLDVVYDESVKDLSRFSYMVPGDYVLYKNEELMFKSVSGCQTNGLPDECSEKMSETEVLSDSLMVSMPASIEEVEVVEVQTDFDGIPLKDIYKAYIIKLNGSLPTAAGNRNNLLFEAGCQLSTICENDYAALRAAAPGAEMGLPDAEVDATIRSVVKTVREDRPIQSKLLKDCVKELKATACAVTVTGRDTVTMRENELPCWMELPKLPPVIKELASQYADPQKQVAVVMACLPLLGAAFGTVEAKYIDRSMQYLVFQVVVEGNSSDGKSFAKQLFSVILRYVAQHDKEGDTADKEYTDRMKLFEQGKLEQKPRDPCSVRQIVGTSTSASRILFRASKSQGLTMIQYTSELDSLSKNNRKGAWGELSELWRLGYENDIQSQDYMNPDTYNGVTTIKLSILGCGTPNAVDRMFKNPEDGCVQRFIFSDLGDQSFKSLEVPKELTDKQWKLIDEVLLMARDLSYDAEGNPRKAYRLDLPWLCKGINNWLEEKRLEAVTAQNPLAFETYRRRSGVNGFRAGMLAWMLWGESPRRHGDVIAFARWVAEYTLRRTMLKFGEKYQKIREGQQRKNSALTVQQGNVLAQLPEEFSRAELYAAAATFGTITNDAQRQLLSRLKRGDFIVVTDNPDVFRKQSA